ncbi:MAG: CotH kinase family protein [Bacteroidales bacterium]|nr:CotH kinase family protein [Bacteroidales bacterium]
MKHYLFALLLIGSTTVYAADPLLTGTPIGSSPSVDYNNGASASTTANLPKDAFDGNLETFYASYERSYTWVGLDLGTPHVITRVGWSPRNDGVGSQRVQLGVFEGANLPDFSDALPIYLIDQQGVIGKMSYTDTQQSKGFRYVRYVGPNNARCNIAELAFYGHKGEGDNSHLYRPTNLPLVVIHTQDAVEPADKVNNIVSIVSIVGDDGSLLTDSATTRLRGNASMQFPKKPYRIKFAHKQRPLNAAAKAKKWTLINNYGDKTLMRNIVAFHLSEIVGMPYTPFCRAVDVMLNGEYKGCYQLCDQVEIGKGRINIKEMEPTDTQGDALTGGYFWEIDAYAYEEQSWFNSNHGNPVTIKSPDEEDITVEQSNYLRNYFNSMEADVYGTQYQDPTNGWRRLLDEQTFLKHFLVGEMSGNTDTYWSVYQYKQRGNDTIFTGPVWDFDLAFDNDNRTYPVNNKRDFIYRSGGSHAGDMQRFVDRIVISDPQTLTTLREIWDKARHNGLSDSELNQYIDSIAQALNESQRLNFMRWDILGQWVHQNPQVAGSYTGEVGVLKNFVSKRVAWLDNRLGYTYTALPATTDNADTLYKVWNIAGQMVYQGTQMPALPHGLYLVQHNGQTYKVLK